MAERRLKRIEDLVVRGVHTVENDEHRVCHKPEICDCKCAVCVAAKLPHPQDHAEPWTGRTDLSHAQQDERREMLEAAVTDGLRVVSVMIQRGVPLELVTEEFRKISSKFPEFTVEAVKADAESTPDPVDRELKSYRRVYGPRTTFSDVFFETIHETCSALTALRDKEIS